MDPHLNCTNIYAEVLIPWIKFGSNMKADLEMLSLLGLSTTGALHAVGSLYLILSQFHFQFYSYKNIIFYSLIHFVSLNVK